MACLMILMVGTGMMDLFRRFESATSSRSLGSFVLGVLIQGIYRLSTIWSRRALCMAIV